MPPTPIVDPTAILQQPLLNGEVLAGLDAALGVFEAAATLVALSAELAAQADLLHGLGQAGAGEPALLVAAHALKGTAASLGAARLSYLAAGIEAPLRAGAPAASVAKLIAALPEASAASHEALLAHAGRDPAALCP